LAAAIIGGLLTAGLLFVFWGWLVLPWLAVVGVLALLVRWLRAGGRS
jgi:hypothetical protein